MANIIDVARQTMWHDDDDDDDAFDDVTLPPSPSFIPDVLGRLQSLPLCDVAVADSTSAVAAATASRRITSTINI